MRRITSEIQRIAGNVITVQAEGIAYGELAWVGGGESGSLAQVIRLHLDRASLQMFAGTRGLSTGERVRFLGRRMRTSGSEDLLGRVCDGIGRPRDGGPELAEEPIELGGPAVNPARRVMPSRMIRTGIPMIDVFNTLVESQKISIFSGAGEPHNELMARIALQAEVDIIVLGGMGLRHDDYLYFKEALDDGGALGRSILFIHTASDPVVECLTVPDVSLAVAERLALKGRKVLVLLTDMANFADGLKEVAITMEQVPSNRGYPGDLYSQLAARYEKAVDYVDAGSITILSATTMPGGDVTHPIPDNTGYITEGQYYLIRGRIEPFGSLSRLKQQVNKKTREDHRPLMDAMIRLYASYQETLEKKAMGFQMSSWDRKLLEYGQRFEVELMDLSVHLALEDALDAGWRLLAACFHPSETGLRTELIEAFWPGSASAEPSAPGTSTESGGEPRASESEIECQS